MKKVAVLVVGCALALVAGNVLALNTTNTCNWLAEKKIGSYTDPSNWQNGKMPLGPGDAGSVPAKGITIKAPPEGIVETSTVHFDGNFSSTTPDELVIDTTEGRWYKPAAKWVSDWECFMFMNSASHYFNVESVDKTGEKPAMEFSGGIIRVITRKEDNVAKADWILESGLFDLTRPGGFASGASFVLGGGSGTLLNVRVKPGSMMRAAIFSWRGTKTGSQMVFEGGRHAFNTFNHHDGAGNGSDPTPLIVAGGEICAAAVNIANHNKDKNGGISVLNVTNDARFVCGGVTTVGCGQSGATGNVGRVELFGTAYMCSTNELRVAGNLYAFSPGGEIELHDDAVFEYGSRCAFGYDNGAKAVLRLRDRSHFRPLANRSARGTDCRLHIPYFYPSTAGESASGLVSVVDDAVLECPHDIYVGYCGKTPKTGTCTGTLVLSNRAQVVSGYSFYLGYSGDSRGLIEVNDEARLVSGSDIYIGGVSDNAPNSNNVLRVNGGTVRVANDHYITFNNADSLLELNDGEVAAGTMSFGKTANTSGAVLRQRGGTLSLTGGGLSFAQGEGRVELLGGEVRCHGLKAVSGAAGAVLADGGTVHLDAAPAEPLFSGLAAATLGAKGLTFDAGIYSSEIAQAFADAEGEDGLFVKRGTGTLSVRTSSPHAVTRLEAGALDLASGVTRFGRNLVAAGGTSIVIGAAEGLSLDSAALGDDSGNPVSVTMNPSATIAVTGTLTITNATIVLTDASTDGSYTLFRASGPLPEDLGDQLVVKNMALGKVYSFSVDNTEGGRLVLEVAPYAGSTKTWNGSQSGAWTTEENWTGGLPGAQDVAEFPASAASHAVTLDGGASVFGLTFAGAEPYSVTGGGSLRGVRQFTVTEGEHEVGVGMSADGNVPFDIASGAKGTLSGPLAMRGGEVAKTGRGRLLLSGDNAACAGDFSVSGGTLAGDGVTAFGPAEGRAGTIALHAGTLSVSAAEDVTIPLAVAIARSGANPVVIDTETNVTLKGGLSVTDGSWVKRGKGKLTVEMPEGTFKWSTVHQGDQTGMTAPPTADDPLAFIDADGNVTDAQYFTGFSGVEGAVHVKGAGRDKTVIDQSNWTYVGNKCASSRAAADLTLEDVTYNQGGSGIHFRFGYAVPNGQFSPTLSLANSLLSCNTIVFGAGGGTEIRPVLAVTNAELVVGFALQMNSGGTSCPIARLGRGANVRSSYSSANPNNGAGWQIAQCEIHADDGAIMDSGNTVPTTFINAQVDSHSISLTRGAKLRGTGIVGLNVTTASRGGTTTFDGGIIEYYGNKSQTSMLAQPDKYAFRVLEGGLEMNVVSTSAYSVQTNGIAFAGPGRIVKTGAGRLVWSPRLGYKSWTSTNYGSYVSEVIGGTTANVEGGIEVAAGTMELLDGSAPATLSVTVDSGCALDLSGATRALGSLDGAGRITNGALTSCAFKAGADDVPTLENVSVAAFKVDFGCTEESPVVGKAELNLVRVGTGASLPLKVGVPVTVKAVNSGVRNIRRARVTLGADGLVTAVPEASGAFLLIR